MRTYEQGFTFKRAGAKWTLKARNINTGLFEVAGGGHWEVVRFRRHKKDVHICGKLTHNAGDEYLPCDEDGGRYVFSFNDYARALACYDYWCNFRETTKREGN